MDEFQTLVFRVKEEVYHHLQGSNLSKFLGEGYDFSELRPYDSMDDIRHISWINSAKLGEPYVKKMHQERQLLVHIAMLVDGRAVIGKKQEVFREILAILGYSTLLTHNRLSTSFTLGDDFKSFEETSSLEAFEKSLSRFLNIEPLGLTLDYEAVPIKLLDLESQKSLFFVVGDFLDEMDLSVLAQKHELYVVMVRDRWEENPTLATNEELVNPLTNKVLHKRASLKALAHYVSQLKAHDVKLYAHFEEHQIKYVKIYEPQEVFKKLEELFHRY